MDTLVKKSKKTNRVNRGVATNELIHSAHQGSNDEVFPYILELYVRDGARIADVTYGKGVFWKRVDTSKYELLATDIRTSNLPEGCKGGIDSRKLPYADKSLDAVVFDPPYMHTPGGTAHNGHQNFEEYYANNAEICDEIGENEDASPKYHEAVLDLYYRSAKEAFRVLKEDGIYIVKCQDEVCTNRQRLTHLEITIKFQEYGFIVEDLFVIVRKNSPGVSRIKTRQYHARKNHSYFMVYRKPKPKKNGNGYVGESSDHSEKNSAKGLTVSAGNTLFSSQ
jgi:hypothetical protein